MERLLADECVHLPVAEMLRDAGHDVLLVKDICPGCKDDEVLRLASEEGRILLTRDKDFGDLTIRFRKKVPGIIRYNLLGMSLGRGLIKDNDASGIFAKYRGLFARRE